MAVEKLKGNEERKKTVLHPTKVPHCNLTTGVIRYNDRQQDISLIIFAIILALFKSPIFTVLWVLFSPAAPEGNIVLFSCQMCRNVWLASNLVCLLLDTVQAVARYVYQNLQGTRSKFVLIKPKQ